MGRFSQAIAEGDGISIVPLLEGDVAGLASQAESSGAEAVAVRWDDVVSVRAATALPVVVDDDVHQPHDLERLTQAGVDACIVLFDPEAGLGEMIDDLYPAADRLDLDCAVEVRDAERLADVLERFDPEIFVIADARLHGDEEELEHVLDLLPDIPAGKLVIARTRFPIGREQALALERAGVDAVLVGTDALMSADFSAVLAELTGRR
jgi:indole-3-glycerol phosphate synthase